MLAHGANVDQLKNICAALEDCEGFNSEGWIKSRVSGKRRATLDLYLKQMGSVLEEESMSLEDMAAGVFRNHMTEYGEMEKKLRMYPLYTPSAHPLLCMYPLIPSALYVPFNTLCSVCIL